ncbi:FAD-binding oxidoreductase [Glycomyces sp. TRM65418]|uniref:FAD-binding oxidoreductase n=1 Tax=Glycomyces sp. TRM65418 TaxID=2867006 RepID=UPI001CE5BCEE|nr:FAD-binding oxidoreductase [Glycomyces sp. TRM65418]MCC3765888.1 FAD-binding oxidoreductase [Glycomyces sp. TRM65418]QZD55471.1 FAD-binding oxidoreductase [Glycomyces sp. TRM65418]
MIDLDQVRERLDGEVLEPSSPGYEAVRRPAHPGFADVRPRFVFRCRSVADVALALAYARETGIHIAPRSGGHCFAGRSSTEGIVLDLAGLDAVAVDGDLAVIGAGARLARVYAGLHEHGRTLPAGCGPTVGIAGLTLGGGIGLLGRAYGLTCDRLVGAQAVLADGRVVDCDRDREPDLFWALRGAGGGQFGVVTALTFATVPEPTARPFRVRWPRADVADVIAAWQRWAPDAPDGLTANLAVVAEPGRPAEAVLSGASLLAESPTEALLGEFRSMAGSHPPIDIGDAVPYHRLKATLAEADPDGRPGSALQIRSEFFAAPMRPETIRALTAALGNAGTGLRRLAFTPMGGAYNRVPASATAFAHRGERYLVEHGAAADPVWVDASWSIAHADGSGRVYPNFPDPALEDGPRAYHADNLPRLAAVKAAYDPGRRFAFPQSIPVPSTAIPNGDHPPCPS